MRKLQWISVLICVTTLLCAAARGQAGQRGAAQSAPAGALAASDVVVGSGSFSPIVSDLDKSLAFYRDLFGITSTAPAPAFSNSDAGLLNFLGVPQGQVRVSQVPIPGTNPAMNVELVDFKDVDRKPTRPRQNEVGATRLILLVRDVNALAARLKAKKLTVVSIAADGQPHAALREGPAFVVSDPDGFAIELLQLEPLPPTANTASGDILGARVGLTVEDMDKSLKVYRDILKLQVLQDTKFPVDMGIGATYSNLLGLNPTAFRRVIAGIPGSTLQLELLEFPESAGNGRGKPLGARIQDPGATRLQLRVRDSAAAIVSLKAAGGMLVTTGTDGGPIDMRGLKLGIVRDLNNLFLVLFESGAPRG